MEVPLTNTLLGNLILRDVEVSVTDKFIGNLISGIKLVAAFWQNNGVAIMNNSINRQIIFFIIYLFYEANLYYIKS